MFYDIMYDCPYCVQSIHIGHELTSDLEGTKVGLINSLTETIGHKCSAKNEIVALLPDHITIKESPPAEIEPDYLEEISPTFARQHGLPIPDEILAAIGCTVAWHSLVEHELCRCIQLLTGLQKEKADALTAGMSFRSLCAALSSLIMQILREDDERYVRFQSAMGRLQHFEEFRNQIAHSVWVQGDDDSTARVKTTARQWRGVQYHVEHIEIGRISAEVLQVQDALNEFRILMVGLPGVFSRLFSDADDESGFVILSDQ